MSLNGSAYMDLPVALRYPQGIRQGLLLQAGGIQSDRDRGRQQAGRGSTPPAMPPARAHAPVAGGDAAAPVEAHRRRKLPHLPATKRSTSTDHRQQRAGACRRAARSGAGRRRRRSRQPAPPPPVEEPRRQRRRLPLRHLAAAVKPPAPPPPPPGSCSCAAADGRGDRRPRANRPSPNARPRALAASRPPVSALNTET